MMWHGASSFCFFFRTPRSKRKTSEMKQQRKRIRPCLNICQTVEERCPYLLPGDRSPGYNTQYAGEPTFLCNGKWWWRWWWFLSPPPLSFYLFFHSWLLLFSNSTLFAGFVCFICHINYVYIVTHYTTMHTRARKRKHKHTDNVHTLFRLLLWISVIKHSITKGTLKNEWTHPNALALSPT